MQETNPSFPPFCWVLFGQCPIENAESVAQRDRRRRRKGDCCGATEVRSAAKWHAPSSICCKKLTPLFRISVGFYLFSAPLTDLNLERNAIGVEGAKAIAAVLARCVQLQNGMRSAPSDAGTNPSFPHFFWVLFGQRLIEQPRHQLEQDRRRRR